MHQANDCAGLRRGFTGNVLPPQAGPPNPNYNVERVAYEGSNSEDVTERELIQTNYRDEIQRDGLRQGQIVHLKQGIWLVSFARIVGP